MDSEIARLVQTVTPGNKVELFDIDFRPVHEDGTVLRFYPASNEADDIGNIQWQAHEYVPLPIEFIGADVSSQGALPRPTLRVSNIFGVLSSAISAWGRVEGAIVTRWQTFEEFLDNGSNPNPLAYAPVDLFIIDRVIDNTILSFEVECRSYIDVGNRKLPGRQMLRNTCTHSYRVRDGSGGFNYSKATCPYTGGEYFTPTGEPTTPSQDMCGKRLSDCRLRFENKPLPTRAFLSLGRFNR